ncbi:Sapep family Mn(2+)-dependent dipeptidase [Faecalibacillus intestinalis]|uniref:Sapep family Mn(2+)-dependent dipeptidase n=1 Tax=Faecalibacillus intestinalis TaxID=1982626 RepID=UPI003265D533
MEEEIIKKIDMLSLRMIEDIKTIVKMPSVEGTFQQGAPFGKDIALTLDKVLEIAQSLGFETKNLDHYIGYAQYGKGEDYIGIIGHLDVVPTGLGWKHPPFSAYEEDGYIYSRGILDNKGPIMTCLYALYAIKELNIKLHKPVRIIFGCDEETGFKDLEYYLKHEKPPVMGWTPDCKYPVVYAERGRAVIEISAKEKQVDEFFLFINNYFLNANTNAEKLGLDFKDEEFGINEMRNFVLKHEKSKLVFSVTFSYPANMTLETIVETIREKAKNMEVTCVQHYFPVKFEKDCPMVSLLSKAYEKITHLDGTPVTTTGGTYAKLMPHIAPFGPSFPGQKGIGHQPNEWMKIEDLNTNAKIYALGIYYLGML